MKKKNQEMYIYIYIYTLPTINKYTVSNKVALTWKHKYAVLKIYINVLN